MSPLDTPAVQRVREALRAGGSLADVVVLSDTARSAEDAAAAIGCPLGAIVKTLVFVIHAGGQDGTGGTETPVLALIAGDRRCREAALPPALGLAGTARRPDGKTVRAITGFAIGGVAPVGLLAPLPCVIDASLGRFDVVHAAAGHPHCVFPTSMPNLNSDTGTDWERRGVRY